ncbi:hypothetical protein OKW30_004646 [Paraburkholderia sp. Clong3]|uniref:BPSL0761 family protein n=1 Tax=Paraburkholderia sp. Clong3 TaxID=2991061 RepID=UPI003D1B7662
MTMPDERTRALLRTRELLIALSQISAVEDMDALRQEAIRLLRHYPDGQIIELIARGSAGWLAAPK